MMATLLMKFYSFIHLFKYLYLYISLHTLSLHPSVTLRVVVMSFVSALKMLDRSKELIAGVSSYHSALLQQEIAIIGRTN